MSSPSSDAPINFTKEVAWCASPSPPSRSFPRNVLAVHLTFSPSQGRFIVLPILWGNFVDPLEGTSSDLCARPPCRYLSRLLFNFLLQLRSIIAGLVVAAFARTARANRWPCHPSIPLPSESATNALISSRGMTPTADRHSIWVAFDILSLRSLM